LVASAATTVLQDSADGWILGVFLFILAVCVLLLSYMIAAHLKQGIWGGALGFAAGYGLLMLHTVARWYTIPAGWDRYMSLWVWAALLVFCDLVLVLAAGFVLWGIRRWLLDRRARPRQ